MKELEQFVAQSRAKWRGFRARLPLVSRGAAPIRLVLDLQSESDSPPSPAEWKKVLVSAITWLGPTRVCIKATAEGMDLVPELVRFCHRLECPTHLVTSGPVTDDEALVLLDRGLGAVTIRVAGLDESVQQAVLGQRLESAVGALHAFAEARTTRGRPLDILVNVPAHPSNLESMEAIAGWALQSGADRVAVGLLAGQEDIVGSLLPVLASPLIEVPGPLRALIEGKKTPVLGLPLVLANDGQGRVRDEAGQLGCWRTQTPEALWTSGSAAIQRARTHLRPVDDVELLPESLVSLR